MDEAKLATEALKAFSSAANDVTGTMKETTGVIGALAGALDDVTGVLKRSAAALETFIQSLDKARVDAFDARILASADVFVSASRSYAGPTDVTSVRAAQSDDFKNSLELERAQEDSKYVARLHDEAQAKFDKEADSKLDFLLFEMKIESDIAREREKLIEERLATEDRLAQAQRKNARTHEQRVKAQTRVEEVEHKKRLVALRKAAAEEKEIWERKSKIVAKVSEGVMEVGGVMYDGILKLAQGEKGAVAAMLEEFLKGVAKKHAILALGEAALAAGSLAMGNIPGVAQHTVAMGLHTGVAVAAGLGAAAAHGVAENLSGAGGGGKSGFDIGYSGSQSRSGGSARSSGGDGGEDGLEAQDVPVSHEQLRRDKASAHPGGSAQITINNPHIYGAGGVKAFAAQLRTELDRQDRAGRKPRL